MGRETRIEWCDATWNPVTGCFNDCPYCYARKIAERFRRIDDYAKVVRVLEEPNRIYGRTEPYPYGFSPIFHKYKLDEPKKWKKPRNIFVCSMADLFAEWIPDDWIDTVFRACEEAPQHNYLYLTKHPDRYCKLANERKLPKNKNFWYGTTITGKGSLRFPGSPVFNTFLSIEPLLEDIEPGLGSFGGDGWIIVGAETGTRKEKVVPRPEWVEKISKTANITRAAVYMKDSLIPIVGEGNMRREFPNELTR